MAIGLPRGSSLPDHARGWGQFVYADDGVGRVVVDDASWVLPPTRGLWVPPGVRHQLLCITDLSLRTLYFPPEALPTLPGRCVVVEVGELLRALVGRVAAAPLADGPPHHRLIAVLHDELACRGVFP